MNIQRQLEDVIRKFLELLEDVPYEGNRARGEVFVPVL